MKTRTIFKTACTWATVSSVAALILKKKADRISYTAASMRPIEQRKIGFYENTIKRVLDVLCASAAITIFSPLYLTVAALVRIKLGSPVLFTQDRPGLIGPDGKEQVFKMYKFRSMTDKKDEKGDLLPDKDRLTSFGRSLRATSLDELPEAINILNGTMSIIGPRPQLVRDLVYMDDKVRQRHTAKPGLSGLAQVNGRNAVTWEQKFEWDLKYIERVSFWNDLKIVAQTVRKVFGREESTAEVEVTDDYGDWLLKKGEVSQEQYSRLQLQARRLIKKDEDKDGRTSVNNNAVI